MRHDRKAGAPGCAADGAQGRIRVRLSASENREPLCRIDGHAFYGSEDKSAMAQELAAFAQALGNGAAIPFEVKRASQRSPWYISAFLCPESGV